MTSVDLQSHGHGTLGFALALPQSWEAAEDLHGTALIAVEPPRAPLFRANVNVTVEDAPAGALLEDWVTRGHEQLARVTDRLYAIDRERTALDGLAAIRSLGHHVDPEHGGIALEQWTLLDGPYAYVISASMAAPEYDELAELTNGIARSFRAPRERIA